MIARGRLDNSPYILVNCDSIQYKLFIHCPLLILKFGGNLKGIGQNSYLPVMNYLKLYCGVISEKIHAHFHQALMKFKEKYK